VLTGENQNIKTVNRSFENVAKYKHLGTTGGKKSKFDS
jgi:hypothetical protein